MAFSIMWRDRESDEDFLNFTEVAEQIVSLVGEREMLPISIGVFGGWGTGKSTVLKLVEHRLPPRKGGTGPIVIVFDAWLYQGFDDAKAALMQVVASKLLEEAKSNEGLFEKAKRLAGRVNYFRALGTIADFGVGVALGVPPGLLTSGGKALLSFAEGTGTGEDAGTLKDTAKKIFAEGQSWIKPEERRDPPAEIHAFRKEFGELLEEMDTTLIVVIDNLDRCLPEVAIPTLEAVRLFLFMPRTAFIIAADEGMIRHSVRRHFDDPNSDHVRDYLDKVIQVPMNVPRVNEADLRAYIYSLFVALHAKTALPVVQTYLLGFLQKPWTGETWSKTEVAKLAGHPAGLLDRLGIADQLAPLLATAPGIQGNPRIVKRLLNAVMLRLATAKTRKAPADFATLMKLAVFERCTDEAATTTLLQIIATQDESKVIMPAKESKGVDLPSAWSKYEGFVTTWRELDPPFLKNEPLRAAAFLSRDVLAPAAKRSLSPQAAKLLQALLQSTSDSTTALDKEVKTLTSPDALEIMSALIAVMRQSGLKDDSAGLHGALRLVRIFPDQADALRAFFQGLEIKNIDKGAAYRVKTWLSS